MIFRYSHLFFAILFLISGCSHLSGPEKNLPFSREAPLARLEGKYQNKAEGAPGSKPIYLSNLVFPESNSHADEIEILEVKKTGENVLLVGACSSKKLIFSKKFKEGKDFKIEKGRISLISKSGFSFASPAGNPLIGYYSVNESIGLDEAGDGKLQNGNFILGTLFVIIPAAISDKKEFRFKRLSQEDGKIGCL